MKPSKDSHLYSQLCDQFQNDPVDESWSLLKTMILDDETEVKVYSQKLHSTVKVRSIVYFHLSPFLVSGLIRHKRKIIQMYPGVLEINKCDENIVELFITIIVSEIFHYVTGYNHIQEYGKEEVIFLIHFFNGMSESMFFHHCKKLNKGTIFQMQCQFEDYDETYKMVNHFMNLQRQFIRTMYYFLIGDNDARMKFDVELEYRKTICMSMERFELIHKNRLFEMWITPEFDEMIVRGVSKLNMTIEELRDLYKKTVEKSLQLKRSRFITKDSGFSIATTTYNYPYTTEPYEMQLIHIEDSSEAHFYSYASSTNYCDQLKKSEFYKQQDKYKENMNKYEIIMSCEMAEEFGNGIISTFHFHYFFPILKSYSMEQKKHFIERTVEEFVEYRLLLQYHLCCYIPFSYPFERPYPKRLLSIFPKIQEELNSFTNSYSLPNESTFEIKEPQLPSFDIQKEKTQEYTLESLSDQLIRKIFEYLPGYELVSCYKTCKRFKSILRNSETIWQNLYNLYFDEYQFRTELTIYKIKYLEELKQKGGIENNTLIIDNNELSLCDNNDNIVLNTLKNQMNHRNIKYCDKVLYNLCLLDHWEKNKIQKQCQIQLNHPIDQVRIGLSNNICCISEGRCIIYDEDLQYKKGIYNSKRITGIGMYVNNNSICIGYEDGIIREYNDENNFVSIQLSPMKSSKFLFDRKVVSFNSENVVSYYDINTQTEVFHYKPHSQDILQLKYYYDNVILTSSNDGTLIGYDIRTNQNAFIFKSLTSYFNCFDWFDNYIVAGSPECNIRMYDLRKMELTLDKTNVFSPLTTLKCFNHKLVFGSSNKNIYYMNCNKGFFGRTKIISYQDSSVTSVDMDDCRLISGSINGKIIGNYYL